MAVYISLLRGINVSGQKKVKMVDLRALYEGLGLDKVKTYVQSGNVVFESDHDPATLVAQIEDRIEDVFGFSTDVQVFTRDNWRAIINASPYLDHTDKDRKRLLVTLLAQSPEVQRIQDLGEIDSGADQYHIREKAIYLYCPDGYGRSKLSNNFWEKKLQVRATTRNWNSMNKLLDLADSLTKD